MNYYKESVGDLYQCQVTRVFRLPGITKKENTFGFGYNFFSFFDNFSVLDVFGVFLVFANQPTVHIVVQLERGRYMAVALAVGVTDKGQVMYDM